MSNTANFPGSVSGHVYPATPNAQFPEQAFPAYNPSQTNIGVAFSGGGGRAMSAAMGQMLALQQISLYQQIGAISCVSGGSWFGTTFTYAASRFSDATLLGTPIPPSQLTVADLQILHPNNICFPLTAMTNAVTSAALTYLYEWGNVPINHLWARLINFFFLDPLMIGDDQTFFTLNNETLNQLLQLNPSLTASNFYIQRPNRPFYIAGATQIYPPGANQVMRQFEYTSMYSGTPQQGGAIGPQNEHFGYGYVDNLLFDTLNPSQPSAGNVVSTSLNTNPTTAAPMPFALYDQTGSSSSAPGSYLDYFLQNPNWFPEFNYWSPAYAGSEHTENYSFADGGDLENTGIIALLRRQFPLIVAFVNTSLPLGGNDEYYYVNGVDAQISNLFGQYPTQNPTSPTNPPTQVFNDNGKFNALAQAFKDLKANDKPLVYLDQYTIADNNYFGVPAYPGNGVFVLWFYNDLNREWYNQLTPEVQALINSKDPENYMANFPNYATVCQNSTTIDGVKVPEILLFTPQQINLLANMQYYTVAGDTVSQLFKEALDKVKNETALHNIHSPLVTA